MNEHTVAAILERGRLEMAERDFEPATERPGGFAGLYLAGMEVRHRQYVALWWGFDGGQHMPVSWAQVHN